MRPVMQRAWGAVVAAMIVTTGCTPREPAANSKSDAKPSPAARTPEAAKTENPPSEPARQPEREAPPAAPPVTAAPPPAPPVTPPATPAGGVTPADEAASKWFITVERAKELFDSKEVNGRQVIFIDARTFLEFRDEGHIRGAMHYATAYTRGRPQPKVTNYLPGSAVVIYCHGELCTDSIEVGRYFESLKLDIGPVFVLKAGFPAWKAAYPHLVDKGNEVGFD